jgi:hypothetical protein
MATSDDEHNTNTTQHLRSLVVDRLFHRDALFQLVEPVEHGVDCVALRHSGRSFDHDEALAAEDTSLVVLLSA